MNKSVEEELNRVARQYEAKFGYRPELENAGAEKAWALAAMKEALRTGKESADMRNLHGF